MAERPDMDEVEEFTDLVIVTAILRGELTPVDLELVGLKEGGE